MDRPPQTWQANQDEAELRLDQFIARHLHIGRAAAQRMIADGMVKIDGIFVDRKGLLLAAGQKIEIAQSIMSDPNTIIPNPDLPLVELNRGEGWIAVDKPAGLPVHPLRPGETQTLLNAVIAHYPHVQGIGEGGLRSGVVHRLDVDTSGVILFAIAENTWHYLRTAFQEHRAEKIYHAIVAGKLTGSRRLVLDLRIAQHSPAKVKVVEEKIIPKPPGTRRCDLTYRAIGFSPSPGTPGEGRGGGNLELRTQNLELEKNPHPTPPPEYKGREKERSATLLEISLGTGFLHQIRVMLAQIGHPVLGDRTYGPAETPFPRQLLHAQSIRIGDIYAESPYPADFANVLSSLGLDK